MTEKLQQNAEQQGPFSPLQSGCAFVMLTNMLIYLAVVAFTFNLLDPSKLNASYLATRGFTARPEPQSEQDIAFQRLAEQKRQQQESVQAEAIYLSKQGVQKNESPAAELSDIKARSIATSRPQEPGRPEASLTKGSFRTGRIYSRSAASRLYSVAIFPQATMRQTYAPYRLLSLRPVELDRYEPLPVELASLLNFPVFRLPSVTSAGDYLYSPPGPLSEPLRGGPRFSVPPTGAESLYTNSTKEAKEPPAAGEKPLPAKDQP